MSLQVEQLLDSLRTHGTIDSEGQFTLSRDHARAKMAAFASSDPARYLVSIVSGGVGAGASRIRLVERFPNVSLEMVGARLTEDQLLAVLEPQAEFQEDGSVDLVYGCRGALTYGAAQVTVSVHDGDDSYCWHLSSEREISSSLDSDSPRKIVVDVAFPISIRQRFSRFVGKLRGYVGQRPEFRLITKLMDRSPVTITINKATITRSYIVPPAPAELKIGLTVSIKFGHRPLQIEGDRPWSGCLAFTSGTIEIVVRGVICGRLDSQDFSGVIYHDSLPLDLSREHVREGETLDKFLAEVEEVRVAGLLQMSKGLPSESELPWYFQELFHVCTEPSVEGRYRKRLLDWMSAAYSISEAKTDDPATLLQAGLELATGLGSAAFAVDEHLLLTKCVEEFERFEAEPVWIPLVLRYYRVNFPQDTLIQGYLLLGLGALREHHGDGEWAQKLWLESLDTVRAGRHELAERLIHAHMDYDISHMLSETRKALALHARLRSPAALGPQTELA